MIVQCNANEWTLLAAGAVQQLLKQPQQQDCSRTAGERQDWRRGVRDDKRQTGLPGETDRQAVGGMQAASVKQSGLLGLLTSWNHWAKKPS